MKAAALGSAIICLIAGAGAVLAQNIYLPQSVYKWVDDDNVTHFSAQPPPGMQVERTTVRIRGTNQQSLQARTNAQGAVNQARATRREQEDEVAAENGQIAKKNQKIREQNCAQAQQQQKTYNEAHRLYRVLEDGNREYLTSDQIDAERVEANREVQEWCG